jgi:hypothetical protein
MLKNNPVVKKLVETGEERVGKLAQALLSNERFVMAIHDAHPADAVRQGRAGQEPSARRWRR